VIDLKAPVLEPTPVVPLRRPPWYRSLWFAILLLAAAVVLLVVGIGAFSRAGSADDEAANLRQDVEAATARLVDLDVQKTEETAVLDSVREAMTGLEVQRAAVAAEVQASRADLSVVEEALAGVNASLRNADRTAIAVRDAAGVVLDKLEAAVSAHRELADDFQSALEDGNRRSLDAMMSHFEDSLVSLEALRGAVAEEESALLALQANLFDAGGSAGGGILATESFDDADSGWTIASTAEGSLGYVDGTYQVVARAEGVAEIGFMPISIANIAIEVDVEIPEAPAGSGYEYGVVCRAREAAGGLEGYLLSVGATHVRIAAFGVGGEYQELTPWRDVLAEATGSRTVAGACAGDRIALYVDGELVAEATEIGLTGAGVGVFAVSYGSDPVTARFDDLRLVHPSMVGPANGG
jgi:hypothetical protein